MENKNNVYLTPAQAVIQISYFIIYGITSAGIAGNFDANVTTPVIGLIIHFISTILVGGKIIYWCKMGRLF